jgi:hypothetical protein
MIVDKAILEKLRSVLPATGTVEFVTLAHKSMLDDAELAQYAPVFRCRQLTNAECEKAKEYFRDKENQTKDSALTIVGNCIESWKNLYDIATGEEFKYSPENVKVLPELVVKSILTDLWQYSGSLV